MGSSRLPGKIMSDLAGYPALWHVVDRLSYSKNLDQVVVATTDQSIDDQIEIFCQQHQIACFRGSESDVLDRYYQASKRHQADTIVRVTADCPVIDPVIVDEVLERMISGGYAIYDFVGEFPDGLDVSVFTFEALEKTWKEAELPSEREHVGPYMKKLSPELSRGGYSKFVGLGHHRWTLDEPKDLELLTEIFNRLYREDYLFLTADILQLLEERPELVEINDSIIRNEGYLKSLEQDEVYRRQHGGQKGI